MTSDERVEQEIIDKAHAQVAALRKKRERQEQYRAAPDGDQHDEEKCEDNPCKDCLVEIDAHEQEYAHLVDYD